MCVQVYLHVCAGLPVVAEPVHVFDLSVCRYTWSGWTCTYLLLAAPAAVTADTPPHCCRSGTSSAASARRCCMPTPSQPRGSGEG